MAIILITGMSGTGTSSVLAKLAERGWDAVDTDYEDWKVPNHDGDMIWAEDKADHLLTSASSNRNLAIDGCVANQGRFYNQFDAVVLLTAPIEVMLDRISRRRNNGYGKTPEEQQEIWENTEAVVPFLRASADIEVDTSVASVDEVASQIIALASNLQTPCDS